MSDPYREHHPLLCDEVSEEEHKSPHYQRRFRPMIYKGRARNQAKGATTIITQWPDHWTSSITYWWIILSMFAITAFLVYNTIMAFALLPPTNLKPTRIHILNKTENMASSLPDIFMHLIVNPNEEIDINKYLPSIEILSNQYLEFKYHLIVLLNDTENEVNTLSAEETNNIAFHSLWTQHYNKEKTKLNKTNIHIEHLPLSYYMNRSPLKKYWRHLPHQYTEFLARAISIWDKGGVAFNPIILTSQSPHKVYVEKLRNILQNYRVCSAKHSNDTLSKTHLNKQKDQVKRKVNNIQDIIDILEHDGEAINSSQYSLTEAETRDVTLVAKNARKLLSSEVTLVNKTEIEPLKDSNDHLNLRTFRATNETNNPTIVETQNRTNPDHSIHESLNFAKDSNTQLQVAITESQENNNTKLSLLPLFLEFLFHDKSKFNLHVLNETKTNSLSRQRKSANNLDSLKRNGSSTISSDSTSKTRDKYGDEYKPMIIFAKDIKHDQSENKIETNKNPVKCKGVDHLTIDLKGNILATAMPCHAFIGTVFSNVIYHTEEESLHDFIITELSIFCKGLLSTCKGIDVILL